MPAHLEFDFASGRTGRVAASGPMRLLLLADFSADSLIARGPLAARATQQVDFDNLDEVLARFGPRLAGGEVGFESIEDFHPDALYSRLAQFEAMRQARESEPEAGPGLLGQLLGGAVKAAPAQAPAQGIDALIRSVVAPHIVPDRAAQVQAHQLAVDAAISEQMRKLLHDPSFQALEAAWRGVHWLMSNLELNEDLELHLLDVTRDELLADLIQAQGKFEQTGLHHALVGRHGDRLGNWSALLGLYQFGASDQDVGLLAALGLVASKAGGPFLAGGDPALASSEVTDLTGWPALRRSEASPWIGLAAPRFLLRLPHGKSSDPVEGFKFEEFDAMPVHEEFLWGNPVLALGLLIGRAFTARGWEFEPGDLREIGDLPAFSVQIDGQAQLQACSEYFFGEEAAQAMLATGLMPLVSHRHRNALTVPRFQSVASPAGRLAGFDGRA